MDGIIAEARELKYCLLAGLYERAYELAQNIDDEATTMEIKKRLDNSHQAKCLVNSQKEEA